MVKFDHNKMRKTRILLRDSHVQAAIPKTVILSASSLRRMLGNYRTVYVKPNVGALGVGVMRVRKLSASKYEWRYKLLRKHVSSITQLMSLIHSYKKSGSYLVQRGINLMKYRGSRFDLRVVTQRRNSADHWRVTGVLARVAAPGRIVTNGSQGASIHPYQQVFGANMSARQTGQLRNSIDHLALRIAKRYTHVYTKCIELGLDVAVDDNRRIWLLEVNTRPQIKPFTKLKNLSMYRTIMDYRGKNKGH
ncbi:YheC/D-like protein [Paenibacillus cellulosilyticus]|uniref:YheC/D-like protein n=1 Tax=Paenibacillus cellulosilyticus TaxID=375489 RepID=A0A2V2YGM9_9BACL|nr:YheC/YheD family protein [Paenibacillus cellulosilyticus]PWV92042.1 YheC/D-like protein [Paenibacillus cellulosilyticus]QKS46724.1 YheC/YheD family protein [Paenibacillus cellulosilyticus]